MTVRLLTERYEAIVRLVHAQGRASIADVLSAYRAAPLSADTARQVLEELTDYGWLDKLRGPERAGRAVAWAVAEPALPYLLRSERLPLRPAPARRRSRGAGPCASGPVTPHTYRTDWKGSAPWSPPPAAPVRAGALDFLKCPSHGSCR